MKVSKSMFAIGTILLFSAFITYTAINWKIKDDYTIAVYQGGNKFITFKGLKADIVLDEENMKNSRISATINSDVVVVEPNKALENDAESEKVLDVKNFPTISFESNSVMKTGNNYEATGKLTIKKATKEIKLPFTFENEILKGTFNINLADFDINHPGFTKQLQVVLTVPVTK